MIKYRRLTDEELKLLETDFVRFLAANSIPAADWKKMKSDSPEKVDELLDVFSNTVLEKVYSKTNYLLIVNPNEIHAFKMGKAFAQLIGVKFKDNDVNLLKDENLKTLLSSQESFLSLKPELFILDKKYDKPKAEEVFFLVNQGAEVVDKIWFEFLGALKN
jgi:hypothetical protein